MLINLKIVNINVDKSSCADINYSYIVSNGLNKDGIAVQRHHIIEFMETILCDFLNTEEERRRCKQVLLDK